eukprot:605800-Ditylum_brightwellii.AAC.1
MTTLIVTPQSPSQISPPPENNSLVASSSSNTGSSYPLQRKHRNTIKPPPSKEITFAKKVLAIDLDCPQGPVIRQRVLWPYDTTKTWQRISEEEYNGLKPVVGKSLPTIVITTIKKDKHGKPETVKYHIMVLGNLDPHDWTKFQ